MSETVRGTIAITDRVRTHTCGQMPRGFTDKASITAHKFLNHIRGIGSFTPNILPTLKDEKKLNIYVITITLSKVANPFLCNNRKKSNVVKVI